MALIILMDVRRFLFNFKIGVSEHILKMARISFWELMAETPWVSTMQFYI